MPVLREDKKSLPVERVTSEALQLTELLLEDLRKEIRTIGAASIKEKQEISGMLTKLMRAAAGMVKEARALVDDTERFIDSMEYDEQCELIEGIIDQLPPEYKAGLRKSLQW